MALLDELRANREKILAIAAECGLTDIKIFGSVARGQEGADSDIDVLVTAMANSQKGLETFGFPMEMEEMFGRKVDMVFEKGLNPIVRKYVIKDMVAL